MAKDNIKSLRINFRISQDLKAKLVRFAMLIISDPTSEDPLWCLNKSELYRKVLERGIAAMREDIEKSMEA